MNLYNRAEKYKKYYFWNFGCILTSKGLSNKEIKCIIDDMGVECIIKVDLPQIELLDIMETIKNEERLSEIEKRDLLNKLPIVLKSIRLERYEILVKDIHKEVMGKYLIEKGFYPVFLEDSFTWRL
jgi:arsenate reductase-like glutaredoxin family protein